MNTTPVQDQIQQLRETIRKHDIAYYVHNKPSVPDSDYDKLYRELEKLEKENPQFQDPESPTQRVGSSLAAGTGFQQQKHRVPMLSIQDVFESANPEEANKELEDFVNKTRQELAALGEDAPDYVTESKIDGLAIELVYINNRLQLAVTRGDGETGDDVTANARTIRSIPLILNTGGRIIPEFIIRGEVCMTFKTFQKLNKERDEAGLDAFANPRNAASGSMKLLDPSEVAKRNLHFVAHGVAEVPETLRDLVSTQSGLLGIYHLLGFQTPEYKVVKDPTTMVDHYRELRQNLPYPTDGMVVKVDQFAQQQKLGSRSKTPKWAAAFKFLPEQKETTLKDIIIQVGRTGVLTPVAALEPVHISGSTVSRATLHNETEILRKDIRIGDTIVLEKAGEIIPAVVKVIQEKRPAGTKPFSISEHCDNKCPECGGPILREEGFVAWRCISFECPAQTAEKIRQFASRKALDLSGIGETVADALVRNKLCKSVLDLFRITKEQWQTLNLGTEEEPRRFGAKNAEKVLAALNAAFQKPLDKWLYALSIPQVGESSAKELSRLHEDIRDLGSSQILRYIRKKTDAEATLKTLDKGNPGIAELQQTIADANEYLEPFKISAECGPALAKKVEFFFKVTAPHLLEEMFNLNLRIKSNNFNPKPSSEPSADKPLAGTVFVLTGTLTVSRDEMKALLESKGAKVSGSISAKTTYLLAGDGGGGKRDKAEALGVRIIDETEARNLFA